MPDILLLNGPNLGRLGKRVPEIYGTTTLAEIEAFVRAVTEPAGFGVIAKQSDSEGELIGILNAHRDCAGAIVNPAALMIAGWSLRDALEDFGRPWVEVHISNIYRREEFRQKSVLAPLASAVIVGAGPYGYVLGAHALVHILTGAA
ncbi:MAG TPA: type II 3-dehydroquinate dehydratase [Candidatus Elarobacter sp.]|nr:type II 3-dehydroquinate dehydratase [Candidatus Elarobacter sp.]